MPDPRPGGSDPAAAHALVREQRPCRRRGSARLPCAARGTARESQGVKARRERRSGALDPVTAVGQGAELGTALFKEYLE